MKQKGDAGDDSSNIGLIINGPAISLINSYYTALISKTKFYYDVTFMLWMLL